MKGIKMIKQGFTVALCITGINLVSSCDSCSRNKSDANEMTEENYGGNTDTTTLQEESSTSGSGSTGYQNGSNNNNNDEPYSGTSYGSTNDPVENSSSNAVKKNGEPTDSGGTSGTGMGTGTGSTGNNSRVSKKEDQYN
ncbi:hypothetical protein [Flavobacterium sp. MK4S-17]|uniref:hypothetical protein n=1 Tax=Flavobacterium sp. MK4S-17 TaxID=2543737 RepID=UPI001357C397|nr:hypothetical protein [Flavobacterium sp. MK4S-17]